MGNDVVGLCKKDVTRIAGFEEALPTVEKDIAVALPKRTQLVENIYTQLARQQTIQYSLEQQKDNFQPIKVEFFDQSALFLGWTNNQKPHGPGQIYFHNGDFLQAIFKEGEIDCPDGLFIEHNGNYYRGGFKNSKQGGAGVLKEGDRVMRGHFTEGQLQGKALAYLGKGEIRFDDGRIYNGNIKNGQMEGKGTMRWKNGDEYQGYFREGRMQGLGCYKNSRWQYHGPFVNQTKQGKGTILFADGRKFEGWFQNDAINGYGEFHFPNRQTEKGIFKNITLI